MSVEMAPPHHDEARLASQQPVAGSPPIWRGSFARGFVYAFAGVKHAVLTQRNMRVHLLALVVALGAGVALGLSPLEFALILLASAGVIVAEMVNTVAEAVVDLVTSAYHPLAKIAKDVAAGAVLVAAGFAVVIGLLVFGPHLLALFTQHH